jgi:hypothetical protein
VVDPYDEHPAASLGLEHRHGRSLCRTLAPYESKPTWM